MQTGKSKIVVARGNSVYLPKSPRNLANKGKHRPKSPKKSGNSLNLIFITLCRLGIFGVGLGTIMGTVLANIDLTKPLFPNLNLPFIATSSTETTNTEVSSPSPSPPLEKSLKQESNSFDLNQKLTHLEQKLTALKTKYSHLTPGAFFVDLDNGAYADLNGTTTFSAASTIKIPILVAFFQDVDAKEVYLDEELVMDKEVMVGGSGNMQYQEAGKKYSAIDTATEMIISSDNTATEMIVRRLGGPEALNKRFKSWGLEATVIRNPLPDLEGTNTTSPKDLAYLLARVNNGELISLKSRDRLLDIMQQTKTKTLLPEGLEKGAVIAHKTGDIGTMLGDAGIIDITTGKRYLGAVLVKRPHNDYSTRTFIQEISSTVYQHFKWYLPHPPLTNKT